MKPLSPDTTIGAQRVQFELMRRLPGWERLLLAFELTQATRRLVLANICSRHPGASEEEIRKRFIARVLPRQHVIAAYGFDPKLEAY